MIRTLASLFVAAALFAQAPADDSRNTNIPHTKTHFTMPEYPTLKEWEARKEFLRRQILSAAGLVPLPDKTPLSPQVSGRVSHPDYTIEKVLLETMPGYYLGGNLYRPARRTGKFPAVLTPHGHWTYGRLENQPNFSGPALGITLARQGYVVFAYDMTGYNDTVQTPHRFGEPRHFLWAFGPLGLQLWNSIRAVDFVQSLSDVDPERIAVTGASGGGTQTFLLAAVEDRVKYAAPVNMISGIMQGGCACENAPNLRVRAFNVEVGAMMAPRPLFLVSATGDWTVNVPKEEFPAIRKIYELYGKPGNVDVIQIDAPHNYNQLSREAVYRFFGKHILGETEPKKLAERGIQPEMLQDMLALHGRTLPDNALSFESLFTHWKAMSQRQSESIRDPSQMRERLVWSLMTEWPKEVVSSGDGERIVLSRAGKGDRVPGLWIPGRAPAALIVHPDGAEAARKTPQAVKLIAAGRAVLLIDAFQTGTAVAPRDRSTQHFLTFNQSDDANRVQDILTALAFLESKQMGRTELTGLGKAGVWSLFAAAVAPADLALSADLEGFQGTDQDFLDRFFVPGIQRAGGLKAALELTANRK